MNPDVKSLDWHDQLVVVGQSNRLDRVLRRRYPSLRIASTGSYFEGMKLAANEGVRGVLLNLQADHPKLSSVVAGLREAAGRAPRLVICCTPALEPAARRAIEHGADEYLIDPPSGSDLDGALRLAPTEPFFEPKGPDEAADLEAIEDIGALVTALDLGPRQVLDRLAELLRQVMHARGVCISVENGVASAGEPVETPVLVGLIEDAGRQIGQVVLGPRQDGPYTAADAERLTYYTRLVQRFLDSARRQGKWRTLALTDDLTGLPNRRFLFAKLEELLRRAKRERFRVTLLIFDIDDFKRYNDECGHQVGDEILRDTAQLIRTHCRENDMLARYGGDEFVVVFWDADEPRVAGSQHPSSALAVLHRFRKALQSHEFKSLGPGAKGTLTISGGLATFPWDASNADGLIARADEALSQAKRRGKNRIFLVGASDEDASDMTSHADSPTRSADPPDP